MTQNTRTMAGTRRPKILLETARIAGRNYHRESALTKLFKVNRPKPQKALIDALREREADIESLRQLDDGTYRASRHVQVMTALLAELRR